MPSYLKCPHCEHPQIVRAPIRGEARFCRQCGQAYVPTDAQGIAEPLPISTIADLITWNRVVQEVSPSKL